MRKLQKVLVERIHELCKEKGISYYSLAYKAGVPMTTLSHILDGSTKNPGFVVIVRICEALDVPLSEFFDTEDFTNLLEDIEK